ncbi:hypothetical protein O0I10_009760 [Lichtheimia ornata]|uniref:Uncharacterized protein n=1 Tax=Lichtheimia ornata TaxID=688661 RepID=A0AAD7XVI3_9FUNG|nr:uncharacterized protein O0I10_009760 [Lichtheimia ornata]KAJ8654578.1 hypothetical protein O0I10_009760 [Lichtheimia ornata]
MHAIFSHFKGANAVLMDHFFERGWCRDLGENVWRSSKDGRTFHKRRESTDEKIAWNMFLTPRFDMFMYLADYMNMPGGTGEIARGAILFALRLLDGDPEYLCYPHLCEVMAERLALSFLPNYPRIPVPLRFQIMDALYQHDLLDVASTFHATSSSTTSSHHDHQQQPKQSLSTFARSSTSTTRDGPTSSRQPSLLQLVFNKGSSNNRSITPPSASQSPPVTTTTGSTSNSHNEPTVKL